MRTKNRLLVIFGLCAVLVIMVSFQNCSKGFSAQDLSSTDLSSQCGVSQKIFGTDDKVDVLGNETDGRIKVLSQMSVAKVTSVIPSSQKSLASTVQSLGVSVYGETLPVCSDVKFQQQKLFASCSGTYLGNHPVSGKALVMTNAHCLSNCYNDHFIFDASISSDGQQAKLNSAKVISCSQILFSENRGYYLENGRYALQDVAIFEANKPAPYNKYGLPREFMRLRNPQTASAVRAGQALMMVGYPFGLPMKVSTSATAIEGSAGGYFANNLDHFPGNSGAPVIDPATSEIIGVFQGTAYVGGTIEHSFQKRVSEGCLEVVSCSSTSGCGSFDGRYIGGVAVDIVATLARALNDGRLAPGTLSNIIGGKVAEVPANPVPEADAEGATTSSICP